MLHVGAILKLCAFCGNSTINMQLMCLLLPHSTVPNPNRSKTTRQTKFQFPKTKHSCCLWYRLLIYLLLVKSILQRLVTSCNYSFGHRLRPVSCWLAGRILFWYLLIRSHWSHWKLQIPQWHQMSARHPRQGMALPCPWRRPSLSSTDTCCWCQNHGLPVAFTMHYDKVCPRSR